MKKPVECRPGCQCKKGYSKSTIHSTSHHMFSCCFFEICLELKWRTWYFKHFLIFIFSQLVYDPTSKTCMKPSECPCHHAGRSYSENNRITQDCNTWSVVYLLFSLVGFNVMLISYSFSSVWFHFSFSFFFLFRWQYVSLWQVGMHQKSMPRDMFQLGRITLQDIRW